MKEIKWTVAGKPDETCSMSKGKDQQSSGEARNVICGLRLSDDLLRKIDKFCEENDVSRSHVFRWGAKLYIQEREKEDA